MNRQGQREGISGSSLLNPFTPTRSAYQPDEFFGRSDETETLERMISQGHIAVTGPVGIGKTSFLQHVLLRLEGFGGSGHASNSYVTTGNKAVSDIDGAAHLILKSFVTVDQRQKSTKFSAAKILGIEKGSLDVISFFTPGRCLDQLEQFLLKATIEQQEYLVLAIDETDRCPVPMAQLFRSLCTSLEHAHIDNVRFIFAGVNPYLRLMIKEDPGVNRFLAEKIPISVMPEVDADDLVRTKLRKVIEDYEKRSMKLECSDDVVKVIVALSGGHPHILQLLGSHLIEAENADPDGLLDERDLVGALRSICYRDRAVFYDNMLHELQLQSKYDVLGELFGRATSYCPTLIPRGDAVSLAGADAMRWFCDSNLLELQGQQYRLIDEFLRIRMILGIADDVDEVEMGLLQNPTEVSDFRPQAAAEPSREEEEAGDERIREYESMPEIRLTVVNNPGKPREPILFGLHAKARSNKPADVDPELDELVVSIFSAEDDRLIARRRVELEDRLVVEADAWTPLAQIAIGVPEAGEYWAACALRVKSEEPKPVAVESDAVGFDVRP